MIVEFFFQTFKLHLPPHSSISNNVSCSETVDEYGKMTVDTICLLWMLFFSVNASTHRMTHQKSKSDTSWESCRGGEGAQFISSSEHRSFLLAGCETQLLQARRHVFVVFQMMFDPSKLDQNQIRSRSKHHEIITFSTVSSFQSKMFGLKSQKKLSLELEQTALLTN